MNTTSAPTAPEAAAGHYVPTLDEGDSHAEGSRLSTSSIMSAQDLADVASISKKKTVGGVARRTLGIILLLTTVFLWTVSNFLASVSGLALVLVETVNLCPDDRLFLRTILTRSLIS